jgi:hypothetical protein
MSLGGIKNFKKASRGIYEAKNAKRVQKAMTVTARASWSEQK